MPPALAQLDAAVCDSFPPCPGLLAVGAGFHPQGCGSGSASLTVILSVRAGARSPLGPRLGPGSPARLVVSGLTSFAGGCVLNALAPLSVGSGPPGPAAPMQKARLCGP